MTGGLEWQGDLRFSGTVGTAHIDIDGDAERSPSPVQMLASSVAGCMAIDVVHILDRMRTPATALRVGIDVERAPQDPRRVTSLTLSFSIGGAVPEKNVERALELSRATYCSVLHSLRRDIRIELPFEVVAD